MTATTQTKPTTTAAAEAESPSAAKDSGYTAAALSYSQGLYASAKDAVLARTKSEVVKDAFTKAEELTKAGADHIVGSVDPATLAKVVATIDEKVDQAVKTVEPHAPKLRKAYEDSVKTAEGYKTKVVETVRASVDATVDSVLTTTEGLLDAALPPPSPAAAAAEEEEEEEEATTTEAPARVIRIRDVASKRFRRRAMSGLQSLRLRTGYTGEPVDLFKYNELLDLQLVKDKLTGKLGALPEQLEVARGQVYDLVMAEYEARVAAPTTRLTEAAVGLAQPRVDAARAKLGQIKDKASEQADIYVVAPARDYYAVAVAAYAKLVEAGGSAGEGGEEYLAKVRAALGAAWTDKLARPTQQLYGLIVEEWAKVVQEAEGNAPAEGGVDQAKRLEKYVSAVRDRLYALFESYKPAAAEVVEEVEVEVEAKSATSEDLFTDAATE